MIDVEDEQGVTGGAWWFCDTCECLHGAAQDCPQYPYAWTWPE